MSVYYIKHWYDGKWRDSHLNAQGPVAYPDINHAHATANKWSDDTRRQIRYFVVDDLNAPPIPLSPL